MSIQSKDYDIILPIGDVIRLFIVSSDKLSGAEIFSKLFFGISLHTSNTKSDFIDEPFYFFEMFCDDLNQHLKEKKEAHEKQNKEANSKINTSKYMSDAKKLTPKIGNIKNIK